MYHVLEVAKHVINYSIDQKNEISNLKLQKLLYYIQAAFLVDMDRKCFDSPILAWEYGPVVEEVYKNYKKYGKEQIKDRQEDIKCLMFDAEKMRIVRCTIGNIGDEALRVIYRVVDAYAKVKDPFELVKKTHKEDPWKNTPLNEEISIDKIRTYYSKEKDKIYNR